MYRDNRLHVRRRLKNVFEHFWGHTQHVRVDVDETSFGARVKQAIGRGSKGNCRGQPPIAWPKSSSKTRDVQSRRSTTDRDRMTCADSFRNRRLKSFDRRPLSQKVASQHRDNGINVGLINALSPITNHARRHPI